MPRDDLLFCKVDWFSVEHHQTAEVQREIEAYQPDRLLNTSPEDLQKYFVEKYSLDIPSLDVDEIVADEREHDVDVSNRFEYGGYDGRGRQYVKGTAIEITIPFSGDRGFFGVQPTTYTSNPPRATVGHAHLTLEISDVQVSAEQVRSSVDKTINDIEYYLGNLRKTADAFNSALPGKVQTAIEARRQKLLANRSLVSSLGFKLKERADSSRTYVAPDVRRKVAPTPPPASSSTYKPEPVLSENDYNHILSVLENMAQVMQRSPSAFRNMDEESLRSHFLVQLNGHYEGQATGETFNYEGKTDILLRSDGKNVFIGECKFWGGPQKLVETIDQLLGYSSWRDTKVAILVFNRNKDFTNVLSSIQSATQTHVNYKRSIGARSETSFQYTFHHKDDANRELTLTVLAFDVPT